MLKTTLVLLVSTLVYSANAQESTPCGFQRLFKFKPGMTKAVVLDSVNKTFQLTINKQQVEKLPPYKGTGGDSIIKEVISYKADSAPCFKGRNSTLYLQFADNKLYKAYLVTEYPKSAYQEMITNFNSLRGSIKPYWKYEKETKISGNNTLGFGYDYTKVEKPTNKTEKVSLQYVDQQTDKSNVPYLLEVLWVNLANTRMESSNY
jgi:hypothetical protein